MKDGSVTAPRSRRSAVVAGRYATVMSAAALGAAIFRAAVNRIFSAPPDRVLFGSFLFAAILGILWFIFTFACVFRIMGQENRLARQNRSAGRAKRCKGIVRRLGLSFGIGSVLSLSAWSALELSDDIMQSRMLPWIPPLITVQHYGFRAASRLFPCQAEGSNAGCEAYKTAPAFLVANALVYFPFVLCVVIYCRLVGRLGEALQARESRFVRWCVPLGVLGLCAVLALNRLGLTTYNTLYPTGDSHWHFGFWEIVNDVTGSIIVACGFFLPFYFYRAFRRSESLFEKRRTLFDLTSLAALMVVALTLGDVY